MDKDRVKGKAKDVAGRVQRQAGEWTGDEESQVKGTLKQAEGKLQNAVGQVKDAVRNSAEEARRKRDIEKGRKQGREEEKLEEERPRRRDVA
jgi:uncharacterized protein YjbJ (UPF0337 family)